MYKLFKKNGGSDERMREWVLLCERKVFELFGLKQSCCRGCYGEGQFGVKGLSD